MWRLVVCKSAHLLLQVTGLGQCVCVCVCVCVYLLGDKWTTDREGAAADLLGMSGPLLLPDSCCPTVWASVQMSRTPPSRDLLFEEAALYSVLC